MEYNLFKAPFEIEFPAGTKSTVTDEFTYGLVDGGNLFIGLMLPSADRPSVNSFMATCCYGVNAWNSITGLTS